MSAKNVNSTKESVHDYKLYFELIHCDVMQQFVNLNSYNTVYSDIKKMTLTTYLQLKSTHDCKKKIRRYFQNYGVNKFTSEIERINAVNEFKSDMTAFMQLKIKKENKK